ncbi:MAG: DUF5723 family protein [Bacteroidota bacterium]
MRRYLYISLGLLLLTSVAFGQSGLSLYHLGNVVYQSTDFNAAYVPDDADVFLGLPAMSGVQLHGNSKVSFNDVFDNSGENTLITITNAIDELTRQNGVYLHNKLNLLHFGYRLPNNAVVSVFANERMEGDALFTKQAVETVWRGNATQLEEEINLGRMAFNATYFREYGLGLAYVIPRSGLRVGGRVKFYQGFVNFSLPWNFDGSFRTENENNQLNLTIENAEARTSGYDILTGENNHGDLGSHLISNSNTGFGADLGFEYNYGGLFTFALGINDLGYINWKENVTHYELEVNDTTFRYVGADLFGINLIDLQDSIADFLDQFQINDNNKDPYTTVMNPTVYSSVTWRVYPGVDMVTSISSRIVQGEPRFSFGVGARYTMGDWLTVSGNLTKLDQQQFNLGAALSAKVSVFRFYIASDLLVPYNGYSAANINGLDLRAGLNFVFRSRKRRGRGGFDVPTGASGIGQSGGGYVPSQAKSATSADPGKGARSSYFLGQPLKVKGQDGPYSVIRKQKQPKPITGTSSGGVPKEKYGTMKNKPSKKPSFGRAPKIKSAKGPKFRFKGLGKKWTKSKRPKF